MENNIKAEDCTPTWEGLLPLMLDIVSNKNSSNVVLDTVKSEFKRMAKCADQYNELAKKMNEEIVKNC